MQFTKTLLITLTLTAASRVASADAPPPSDIRHRALVETEVTIHRSANPIDRFTISRVTASAAPARRAILFLPPLGFDFAFYEMSDTGALDDSFVGFLATLGYDVYGYSPGTRGLAAGDCEAVGCTVYLPGGTVQSYGGRWQANLGRAVRAGGHLYLTLEEQEEATTAEAFRAQATLGLPTVEGEVIEDYTGGYHFYPGRDRALGWLRDAGFEVIAEDADWRGEWGYRHLLMRSR